MLLLERRERAGCHDDTAGLEMMRLGHGCIGGGCVEMDELGAFPVVLVEVAPMQHCPVCMDDALHNGGWYALHMVLEGFEDTAHDVWSNSQYHFVEVLGCRLRVRCTAPRYPNTLFERLHCRDSGIEGNVDTFD